MLPDRTKPSVAPAGAGRWLLRRLPPAALFALLWAALTGGAPSSWVIGVPIVGAAAAAAVLLGWPAGVRISARGLAAFVPYFLWRSLSGGVDVSWRALRPSMPIAPSLETYRLRLPAHGPGRVLFANVLSLLPGTLTAELIGDEVTIHVLGGDAATLHADAAELERRVAALLGLEEQAP